MKLTLAAVALLVSVTACKAPQHVVQPLVQGTVTGSRTWIKKQVRHYELTVRTRDGQAVKTRVGPGMYGKCRTRGSRVPACNTR